MRVFYLVVDYGYGSAGVQFYQDGAKAQAILDDDENCEFYGLNEGSAGHFDVNGTTNINFSDKETK